MKKIITVLGARPQFIKASAISRLIKDEFSNVFIENIVHTGQHYDQNMSQVFFDELEIEMPKYNLNISGGMHGAMTGRMLEGLELIFNREKPDWVLVYGDTNSTLAGALAAAKLHIPVVHVEAGLRSYNMRMPEEINRILTDRISKLFCCPTEMAVQCLKDEGLVSNVINSGDVMYDVALFYKDKFDSSTLLKKHGLVPNNYVLCTFHRAENTDDFIRMKEICVALSKIAIKIKVIFPLHPRTRIKLQDYGYFSLLSDVIITEPLSYAEMIGLEKNAQLIITDSGGIQKEAYFFKTPCLTIRDETEWVETLTNGCNRLVLADSELIYQNFLNSIPSDFVDGIFGDGSASRKILNYILQNS